MSRKKVLIVDDEPDILELLSITLTRMSLETYQADSLSAALRQLSDHSFDLCLTDMRLPDGDGIELVAHIQGRYPQTPVAVITAHGSIETAISALKAGAFDFVSKPIELPGLREMIEQALKLDEKSLAPSHIDDMGLVGQSPAICELRQQISKLARSQAPIYISGESGSGKERAARLIHNLGPRKDKPFVPVNCGAIPSELMESEFFGHIKGSFTGATQDKKGLFEAAEGGSLFLDEVAELPLPMQVKLLRAIQEKKIRPIGAAKEQAVDVRILSATHKNLAQQVKSGSFREDLFYRINVIELAVPSLRQRTEDVLLLADEILSALNEENQSDIRISAAARELLSTYSFPGNIRELENALERAFTLCDGDQIQAEDLRLTKIADDSDLLADTANTGSMNPPSQLDEYLEEIEKNAILKALEETHWNRTAAAEKLGISFRQMRHRLKKFGIE